MNQTIGGGISNTGGWTCPACGMIVPWNAGHACGGAPYQPQPFYPPMPAPVAPACPLSFGSFGGIPSSGITQLLAEIRKIVREEIDREKPTNE